MRNSEIESEPVTESLSTVLKKARLSKNITIDYIVSETRISKHVIEQIEAKRPENLPEPVFLKGFIKAYAKIVGLDPGKITRLYQVEYGIEEKSDYDVEGNRSMAIDVESEKKNYKLPIIFAVVVFLFLGAVLLNSNKTETGKDKSLSELNTENVNVETENNVKYVVGYKLEVECVEDTTLKISTDGEQVVEYNLKVEEHLELKAEENFNILITNTCGVTLFLNNKVVEVPGKCGQTVNLQLP